MSSNQRPFRFGIQFAGARTRTEWKERARKAEALGYDAIVMPDHLGGQFAIGPALALAAEITTTLRVGTLVLQNDTPHHRRSALAAGGLTFIHEFDEGRRHS